MPCWWPTFTPEVLVAPDDGFGPGSVHAPRFVSRELVQPGRGGRLMWARLADVLATVADVMPLSLYETTADDVTAIQGEAVHCYFLGDGEALVEAVDAEGWRSFAFASENAVAGRLIETITTQRPTSGGGWLGFTLSDRRDGVILADGTHLMIGDLPAEAGPLRAAMTLESEDVQLLLLARLRMPAAV